MQICDCDAKSEIMYYNYNYYNVEAYSDDILKLVDDKQGADYQNNLMFFIKFLNVRFIDLVKIKLSMSCISKQL
jgi:hypothetical protein